MPNTMISCQQLLQKGGEGKNHYIRELIVISESVEPAHLIDDARGISALAERMHIETGCVKPDPDAINIFDDNPHEGYPFQSGRKKSAHRVSAHSVSRIISYAESTGGFANLTR